MWILDWGVPRGEDISWGSDRKLNVEQKVNANTGPEPFHKKLQSKGKPWFYFVICS
jgi:hypothetical protein